MPQQEMCIKKLKECESPDPTLATIAKEYSAWERLQSRKKLHSSETTEFLLRALNNDEYQVLHKINDKIKSRDQLDEFVECGGIELLLSYLRSFNHLSTYLDPFLILLLKNQKAKEKLIEGGYSDILATKYGL